MPLAQFAHARADSGYIYELERGTIEVDFPDVPHEYVKQSIRDALVVYRISHPARVDLVSESHGSVMRMPGLETERHPDISVYLSPPPQEPHQPWDEWTPDIVVEIVSHSNRTRDYVTKRADYLAAGVREYWIIDPLKKSAAILTGRGDTWRERKLTSAGVVRAALLPGFRLPLKAVFIRER